MGGLSARAEVKLDRLIAEENLRPGKPIDKGAIYKILANRVYLGEAVRAAANSEGEASIAEREVVACTPG